MALAKTLARKFLAFMFDAAEFNTARNGRAFFDRANLAAEDTLVGQYERDRLIAQARDLARNNPIVVGLLQRISDMTVGNGIEPRPNTPNEAWNALALKHWREWAQDPEGKGISTLTEILALCATGEAVEGGAAIIKYEDGTIEPVELVRFRPSPDADLAKAQPFKINRDGVITHWCIWNRDENGNFSDESLAHWVRASNVLTMFSRSRPDQVLPTPRLASAVPILRDIQELNQYTLNQAKVQATPAIIHNKADEMDDFSGAIGGAVSSRKEEDPLDKLSRAADMPVISTRGDVKTLAPATPSSTYDSFIKCNLKFAAMSQGVPLDVLMLWFSDGTYSSSKATLTQAHEAILQRQTRLINYILRPLWRWKIANSVARGLLPPPPTDENGIPLYTAVDFRLPSWQWMDSQDQTQTEIQEVIAGVRTLADLAAKRGEDLRPLLRRRAAEINLVKEIAAEAGIDPAQLSTVMLNGGAKPAETSTPKPQGQQ